MEKQYSEGVLFPEMHIFAHETKGYRNSVQLQDSSERVFNPMNRFSMDLCQHVGFTSMWQMPKVKGVNISAPADIFAFYRLDNKPRPGIWAHCYTNDPRLLPFIHDPYRMANRISHYDGVLGLDLSIKPEMPLPIQMAVSFYNKLIMAFWQHCGINVVQNVVWGGPSSFDFCFDGYAQHATVAVNSTGIGRDRRSDYLWHCGYQAMLERLSPTLIIRYGSKRSGEREDISVYYENDNKKAARNHGR